MFLKVKIQETQKLIKVFFLTEPITSK